jgi:hypothetical protein
MTQAIALFHTNPTDAETGKPTSMHKLCQLVSDDHYARTQRRVLVNNSTLARRVKGGISLTGDREHD